MKWRYLLWPFAVLYDLVTRIRNHLYDIGHKPSFRFEIPVVSVGNLNVGGSGKTPMIEYLIRLLGVDDRIATLSRGYGRRTRGMKFAGDADDSQTIGDEPYQLHRKFAPHVRVVVAEDRAFAIPNILNEFPEVTMVLLDDAFQHRSVRPHVSILLTEYSHPFSEDYVLPMGNLREARSFARRADVIVVTKCPHEVLNEVQLVDRIREYAGPKPVFFSTIRYGEPVCFGVPSVMSDHIVVLTGIANPKPFVDHMAKSRSIVRHFQFGDHHRYVPGELDNIVRVAREHNAAVVTTEKDMVRLISGTCADQVRQHSFFYVPIAAEFLKNGSEFDNLVKLKSKAD